MTVLEEGGEPWDALRIQEMSGTKGEPRGGGGRSWRSRWIQPWVTEFEGQSVGGLP